MYEGGRRRVQSLILLHRVVVNFYLFSCAFVCFPTLGQIFWHTLGLWKYECLTSEEQLPPPPFPSLSLVFLSYSTYPTPHTLQILTQKMKFLIFVSRYSYLSLCFKRISCRERIFSCFALFLTLLNNFFMPHTPFSRNKKHLSDILACFLFYAIPCE